MKNSNKCYKTKAASRKDSGPRIAPEVKYDYQRDKCHFLLTNAFREVQKLENQEIDFQELKVDNLNKTHK